MAASDVRKPIDKHIPLMIVAFFAVFIVVDIIMVTLAVKTQTGVIVENAYEKGLAYNQILDAAQEQENLNLTGLITLDGPLLSFSLKDKDGKIIDLEQVNAQITYLPRKGYDFNIPLVYDGHGLFTARLDLPEKGTWNIRIYAAWDNKHYQASQNFLIN